MRKKLVIFLSLLLITVLLIGCSNSSNSIVGKWSDNKDIVEFQKNGTFTASYYWIGGSYTIDGNTLSLAPKLLSKENYTFEINNNELLLKKNGKLAYKFKKVK